MYKLTTLSFSVHVKLFYHIVQKNYSFRMNIMEEM